MATLLHKGSQGMSVARCAIDVRGMVQGVGFRPFVHGLARRFELGGLVYNGSGGVHIEVEGDQAAIDGFLRQLQGASAGPAMIAEIVCRVGVPRGDSVFLIEPSHGTDSGAVMVPPDSATCDACLGELSDPTNRRHGHPFINCTQCGPRASIIADMPYDRERTTMTAFALCEECQREVDDPSDRRFHAQPVACPNCGPRLRLLAPTGATVFADEPIAGFAAVLAGGGIGALKGIGGFHLVCDATSDAAVRELRRRKDRDQKPFAVMVKSLAEAAHLAVLDELACRSLSSAARPVVLVPSRPDAPVSKLVAKGLETLGILLAYAPVHHLLLEHLGGRPLVMTSGNVSDAPIATTDEQAFKGLGQIADTFLTHDREIVLPLEDSVVRSIGGTVVPVRRSRGESPTPIDLGIDVGRPTLALGGHLKAVFAFGMERRAVLGPHFGDLSGYPAYEAWRDAITHFERLFRVRPVRLVHDLHPDYASTRYAEERLASGDDVEVVSVQHHHAHMASCMIEHGIQGDVIGVCFDGMGLGEDGHAWGGEFLVGGYARYERAAHLSEIRLPGGDRAARQPWRAALGHLRGAGESARSAGLEQRVERRVLVGTERLIEARSCPRTTSMGRLFDAVASLALGLDVVSYEGEAGMRLEALATRVPPCGSYPVEIGEGAPFVVDTAPLVRAVVHDVQLGVDPGVIARRFHTSIVDFVALVCLRLGRARGMGRVVLSGGVFANMILGREVKDRLAAHGFTVFEHAIVPPNDGGLCLGQLAVVAHGGGRRTRIGSRLSERQH